jgi:GPI mannosyltransferase 2
MSHLVLATILSKLVSLLLLYTSSHLPLFDSSPLLISSPILRWDSFHFLHIAQHGYVYQYQWAFFPGVPFVIRNLMHQNILMAAFLVAISCDTTRTLYKLTLLHLKSPTLAYLTALLSLIPSNPVTLYFVPYSEPFFTYLSYKGKSASSYICI